MKIQRLPESGFIYKGISIKYFSVGSEDVLLYTFDWLTQNFKISNAEIKRIKLALDRLEVHENRKNILVSVQKKFRRKDFKQKTNQENVIMTINNEFNDDNYRIGDDDDDKAAGFREDKGYLESLYEQYKKIASETLEEKKSRFEKLRIESMRRILTGNCNVELLETYLYSFLVNDLYFTPIVPGMKCQDMFIDRRQNNALHYALNPSIAGYVEVSRLLALATSFVDLEVMNAAVNPHAKNIDGKSALDYVQDLDTLKILECITANRRRDVYKKEEFAARRDFLVKRGFL